MSVAGSSLRRAVSPWGSYSWGYADVGADIFVALGLVVGAAAGAANVAFLFAGVVYVFVGLAYTELASAYPVAGGGQYFVMRGLGDLLGFVAGWAVLLDFTIDIVLFAWGCAGYLSYLMPFLSATQFPVYHFLFVLALIVGLAVLNIIGVRESTAFNGIVSALDVVSETTILFFGFLFTFNPDLLVHSMRVFWPTPFMLMQGVSLAIISFVGLESISQAAEETHRPSAIIPRTSVGLILTILIFALAYSNLALGMEPWHPAPNDAQGHAQMLWQTLGTAENNDKAVVIIARNIPYFGALAALYVPVLGAILLLISSNSGVFGASRIAYSMSQARLLPSIFRKIHRRYSTPVVAIVVFSSLSIFVLCLAALQGDDGFNFLADLYAFGAALSYTLVFAALIALRFKEPGTPRPFRIPLNIRIKRPGGIAYFPIVGAFGFGGIFLILVFVILTHPLGRIAGPAWVVFGLIAYSLYRKGQKLPLFGSSERDWYSEQKNILIKAGELELLDELTVNHQRAREPVA
jgi:basic amino acid/polyamine antiporter, APA family